MSTKKYLSAADFLRKEIEEGKSMFLLCNTVVTLENYGGIFEMSVEGHGSSRYSSYAMAGRDLCEVLGLNPSYEYPIEEVN